MKQVAILEILNRHYPIKFDDLEFMRDGGSVSYTAYSGKDRYFVRLTNPAYSKTFITSMDVYMHLRENNFLVPQIINTNELLLNLTIDEKGDGRSIVLYEFIEGDEVDVQKDAEKIGDFIGEFHDIMRSYSRPLIKRDRDYYIDKYICLLQKMNYPRVDGFVKIGERLWENVKDLPRGICHGDLYSGNIHKAKNGQMYLLDLDTVCIGFPMYDVALICNRTHYFDFKKDGYSKTRETLNRFLTGYFKHSSLSQLEIESLGALLAIYHFALQAVIIEKNGLDRFTNDFFDKQLDWLYLWMK